MAMRAPGNAVSDRLSGDTEAWLPSADPGAQRRIFDLLTAAAATGADPIATLRDGLRRWFGTDAPAMLPRSLAQFQALSRAQSSSSNAAAEIAILPLEPLTGQRRPTLWPQRPKRLPDELFSSWLWRCAAASRVSPALFAADVLGSQAGDVDRDVAPQAVRRLARLSGQTFESLAAGTLAAVPMAAQDTIGGMVENMLLTVDGFLLSRRAEAGTGRDRPIFAYCPRCLVLDSKPYFRRGWRLAPFVVCTSHRTMLLDRCWNCRSRIDILARRQIGRQPDCGSCGVLLCAAPATPPSEAAKLVPRQRNLEAMLAYLVTHLPAGERVLHLKLLSRKLPTSKLVSRAAAMAALLPATADNWFGAPIDPRHDRPLQMLAEGWRAPR